jgi:hypothetical protein
MPVDAPRVISFGVIPHPRSAPKVLSRDHGEKWAATAVRPGSLLSGHRENRWPA